MVIPARYESTRLQGKVLQLVNGKPLIQHVYENACKSNASEVIIAVDSNAVSMACESIGAKYVHTSPEHESGTDRIAQVAELNSWPDSQIIVNVQGDEPMVPPVILDQLAKSLHDDPLASIATLKQSIESREDWLNTNCVKVITDDFDHALYFSRAPIPFNRDNPSDVNAFRHIGLYAYRVSYLRDFANTSPTSLEKLERLEQLRAMQLGHKIKVETALLPVGPGIDTAEDLKRVEQLMRELDIS